MEYHFNKEASIEQNFTNALDLIANELKVISDTNTDAHFALQSLVKTEIERLSRKIDHLIDTMNLTLADISNDPKPTEIDIDAVLKLLKKNQAYLSYIAAILKERFDSNQEPIYVEYD